MAIIGNIRKRSGLLMVFIGGSLLLFVLSDSVKNWGRGGEIKESSIGTIWGNPIPATRYDQLVRTQMEAERNRRAQYNMDANLDEETMQQVKDRVWNSMLYDTIMKRELEKVGIVVTKEELNQLIHGNNIQTQYFEQQGLFLDANKKFSKDTLQKYLPTIMENNAEAWFGIEQDLKRNRGFARYNNMITNAVYATTGGANRDILNNTKKKNIRFVIKKFNDIPDSIVTATDEEIKAYYEEHKTEKQFKRPPSRSFEYVEFIMTPSEYDISQTKDLLAGIINQFKTAKDDSTYVMNKSDEKFYQPVYVSPSDLPQELQEVAAAANIGDVFGPYREGDFFKISKVLDTTMAEARVRHILLKPNETNDIEALKARADSLKRVIQYQRNFEEMVTKFSEDKGSITTGGVYEWFNKYKMVPEFSDACFNGKVGDYAIVETQYGVHLIEILGHRQNKELKLVSVAYKIEPGEETIKLTKEEALNFSIDAEAKDFTDLAQEKGLTVKVEENVELTSTKLQITGMESPRQIIRWAFLAKKGELSEPFVIDNRVVVARLNKIQEDGPDSFENLKELMNFRVLKEKKTAVYIDKMKASSLTEVANNVNGVILSMDGISFSSTAIVGGGGNEPYVIGKIMATPQGKVSNPIVGEVGIYVFEVISEYQDEPTEDINAVKLRLTNSMRSTIAGSIFLALKEMANVEDKRAENDLLQ